LPQLSHKESLDLVVEDENESTSCSSENVGKATLEESKWSFLFDDLVDAIHGTIIKLILTSLSRHHHESSSDGIKWI